MRTLGPDSDATLSPVNLPIMTAQAWADIQYPDLEDRRKRLKRVYAEVSNGNLPVMPRKSKNSTLYINVELIRLHALKQKY